MKPASQRAHLRKGVEKRANYAGTREARQFGAHLSRRRSVRSSTTATGTVVTGTPIVYGVPYTVHDAFGTYEETMVPGVARQVLSEDPDVRFLINHGEGGTLPLARTPSTMTLQDAPTGLNFTATLDTRQSAAADLVIAIDRADVSQMSCAFMVGSDVWNEDYTQRTISSFAQLLDISAVTYPASPTTSIKLDKIPPVGGDDGTQGGGGQYPTGMYDGTGSRSRSIALERDLLRLKHRPRV
jgi:HK97 family phage prohead protease